MNPIGTIPRLRYRAKSRNTCCESVIPTSFVLTSLSLQGNNALFIDKSQAERKEILSQFIGVDIFDKLYQLASDENRENSTLIKKFKSDDFTSKLAKIETDLKESKSEYKLVEIELNGIKDEEDGLNKDLIRLNGKIVKLNSDLVGIDELEKRKKILNDKETEILNTKTTTQERIGKLEDLQLQLEEIIDGFDEEELEEKVSALKICRNDFNTAKHELEKLEIKINSLNDKKAHLDLHKYNPNCEICMENSETILESKKDVEEALADLLDKWGDADRLKTLAETRITEYTSYEVDWKNLQETKEKEDKVDREISSLMNKLASTETEEIRIQTQISEQVKLIEEYHQNEEQIRKNGEVREEIKNKRDLII